MDIVIDCAVIKNETDFHDALAKILSFPSYYGKNLDALWDVLRDTKRPVVLVLENSEILKQILGPRFEKIVKVMADVRDDDKTKGLANQFDFRLA